MTSSGSLTRSSFGRSSRSWEPWAYEAAVEVTPASTLTFIEFLDFVRVERDGDEGGIVPFELWPHLVERAKSWQAHTSEIILKARQLGISTLAEAYNLYVAMVLGGSCLVISKGAADGKDFARKVLVIYDHLPESMQRATLVRNTEEISFVGGGRIVVRAPTEHAGRSQANTLVTIDEASFHPFALANYKAYRPTISAGGQLLIISTANGASGFFYDQWQRATAHETPYEPVFIPWWARPDRQVGDVATRAMVASTAWLEFERTAFTGLPGDFAQEYPASEADAFLTRSGLVYGLDELGVEIFSRTQNIAAAPCSWAECKWRVVGVDPGGRDPNAMVAVGISDDERMHVYGVLSGLGAWAVDRYTDYLQRLESVAHIDAVVVDPSAKIYPTMAAMGWPATPANNDKTLRIATMSHLLRSRRLTIDPRFPGLINEFGSYWLVQRKEGDNGGNALLTHAGPGHHADCLDALGYAVLAVLAGLPDGGEMVGMSYDTGYEEAVFAWR